MALSALIRRLPAAALLALVAAAPLAATAIDRLGTPWWRERHQAKLAEARAHPVDLVLLGDSITQDYELTGPKPWRDFRGVWQRFYADRHALNLGFKGDATAHLLWRLRHGEIDGIAPKAVVILIGANNLGRLHWPVADTVAGIAAVVDEVRHRQPKAGIVLLGILPSQRTDWASRSTAEINAALAARYGAGQVAGVRYVDATERFMTHGALDESLFLDGHLTPPDPPLHPTPEGQARMAEAIEPALSALLRDRAR